MTDINKAFEVDFGIISSPDGDTDGPFYTGGSASPVGLDLPERTIYTQNTATGCRIWQKFGAGTSDWRLYPSDAVSFDPTLLADADLAGTNVLAALYELGIRPYGKDFVQQSKAVSESTTGTAFATYDTLNCVVPTGVSPVNKYKFTANIIYRGSVSNQDILMQFVFGALVLKFVQIEPKDQQADQRVPATLIFYASNVPAGTYPISLQYAGSVASFTATIESSELEWKRVE